MEILLIIYLIVSIALIGIILLQQGKGAEMGASFGAGASNTVFGAAGSGNVLTKTTTILAILFFAIALSISYFNSGTGSNLDKVIDSAPAQQAPAATPDKKDAALPAQGDAANEEAPQIQGETTQGTQQDAAAQAEAPVEPESKIEAPAEENSTAEGDKKPEPEQKQQDNN